MGANVVQTFDSPKCCSGLCSPESNAKIITAQTPTGSVGNLTAGSNSPSITFAREQKLLLFVLLNNGNKVTGTLNHAIGSNSTTFTLTPSGSVIAGTLEAHVWVKDIKKGRKGCTRKIVWTWAAST